MYLTSSVVLLEYPIASVSMMIYSVIYCIVFNNAGNVSQTWGLGLGPQLLLSC